MFRSLLSKTQSALLFLKPRYALSIFASSLSKKVGDKLRVCFSMPFIAWGTLTLIQLRVSHVWKTRLASLLSDRAIYSTKR